MIQRLNKPTGFKNPFGNVSIDINDDNTSINIQDIIDPDYMGAAEYEWGVFPKCIKTMQKMGTEECTYYIHNKPVYIVMAKGCDIDEVENIINYLYFASSLELHNNGKLPEISKSDYSSFYRAMSRCMVGDYKGIRTHGWLNVKKFFGWFLDEDMALAFNSYCNSIEPKLETA